MALGRPAAFEEGRSNPGLNLTLLGEVVTLSFSGKFLGQVGRVSSDSAECRDSNALPMQSSRKHCFILSFLNAPAARSRILARTLPGVDKSCPDHRLLMRPLPYESTSLIPHDIVGNMAATQHQWDRFTGRARLVAGNCLVPLAYK